MLFVVQGCCTEAVFMISQAQCCSGSGAPPPCVCIIAVLGGPELLYWSLSAFFYMP